MAFRVFNDRAILQAINGQPTFLGALVSTGAAVNNATTATPFLVGSGGAASAGTLAGKVLMLQASAAGVVLFSSGPSMIPNNPAGNIVVALQSVLPPLAGTAPGIALVSGERVEVTMGAQTGFVQWLPLAGAANLFVYELN